jgi:DUF4097 and DUF4098 domain-containing protein YvlB
MSERREAFTVGSRPRIELRLSAGRILVDHHEPGGVEVRIDGKNPDGFTIEQYGDAVSIRQSSERGLFGGSHRVSLRVPDDAEIDVSVASADVDVLATIGDLRVSAASGDVSARRVDRDVTLKTASGDLDVEHVGGRVQVTAASGDISIRTVERHCTVSSASGDVELGDVGGDLRAKTASGDVAVRLFSGSEIDCKTVSGDLRAGIAAGRRVEVDLQTMTGSVHLPEGRRQVSEPEDGESVAVRFRSVSGDIRLERA